jgi:hypothetical protein
MLLTLLRLLSVFLVVLVTGPTSAGTINVLGSVDIGPGAIPSGVVDLGGDRGFTLNFSGDLDVVQVAAANCAFPGCLPGTTISLNTSTDPDFGGRATLNGVSYFLSDNCFPNETCGTARPGFSGQVVAPPFGDFTKAILKVPVEFGGTFFHTENGSFVAEQLVGSATATLTLDKFDFGPQFGVAWRYDGIEYELEPVPEPSTLLLFGSTMVGLAFARRKRRGVAAT